MKRAAVAALLAVMLNGCVLLRGRRSAPHLSEIAQQFGCSPEVVKANSIARRMQPLGPGAPLCTALGRYGEPVSMSSQHVAGMELVSLLHRPEGRYISITFVHYDDTKENRELGRAVGRWVVQSFRESR